MDERTKDEKRYDRYMSTARQYMPKTYISRFVAKDFQAMVRAEYAARVGPVLAVVGTEVEQINSPLGQCVCVTCGDTYAWRGGNAIDTGHFISGRKNSIVFEETNVAPQCKYDNRNGGKPESFWVWMEAVHGREEIDRLRRLKEGAAKKFTIEELVDMRVGFKNRLDAAVEKMG